MEGGVVGGVVRRESARSHALLCDCEPDEKKKEPRHVRWSVHAPVRVTIAALVLGRQPGEPVWA